MKITVEKIKSNDSIPTKEIAQDITDTQKEINNYVDEKSILMRNPQENKLRIYLLDGKISQRTDFINKLQQILDYRKENNY